MRLSSTAFVDGGPIPAHYAFATIDPRAHAKLADNVNPDFAWSGVPPSTKSLALICHDPDVPSRGDDVNKEGRVVPAALPRVDFFHWILIDLPPEASAIARGEFSNGVTPRGKPGPVVQRTVGPPLRQGLNDYTSWFAGDKDMAGNYFGYDGAGPPWNDELPHRYVFTLYALDVLRLDVDSTFRGVDVRQAIEGRIVDQATHTGRYTLNPDVRL